MPKKKSYITITDQFCEAVGGVEIKLALNHWKLGASLFRKRLLHTNPQHFAGLIFHPGANDFY